jgi:hypothetical protein
MKLPAFPTETEIRKALITRANAFCRLTGVTEATLCREALRRDGTFLARVKRGENFTVKTYQRLNVYIDQQLEAHTERARTLLKAASK